MDNREQLQAKLETFVKPVYFVEPPTKDRVYPHIKFELESGKGLHANNSPYLNFRTYKIILVSKSVEPPVYKDISNLLNKNTFDEYYVDDNLHHYVFKKQILL